MFDRIEENYKRVPLIASAYLKDSECFFESNMAQRATWNSKWAYSLTEAGTVGIAPLAYAVQEFLIASMRTTGVLRLSLGLTGASAHLEDTERFSESDMAKKARWKSGRAYSPQGRVPWVVFLPPMQYKNA
ncbi:hypothetical protein QAD02_021255 [Eretmocerus hayati]|uniref:Uncharacterized protein n=1 Tax=Eretmocerus hayati TaxID=131215 RepID=A0ACC2PPX9_9HYME|nr:hypothetical protein QAD02_021255 [Eretmocerus hayati]